MKIKELMRENPIAVGPETPLRDVAIILTENGFSGLPVIGERLEVLGVVSEADILVKEQGPATRRGGVRRLAAGGRGPGPGEAGRPNRSRGDDLARDHHHARRPRVVRGPLDDGERDQAPARCQFAWHADRDRHAADLVRAFARPDHEIEREIREDVMERILWLDAPSVVCASSAARRDSPGDSTGASMPSFSSSSWPASRASFRCTRRSGGAGTIERCRGERNGCRQAVSANP